MNTPDLPEQLYLAADIIKTGHPWERYSNHKRQWLKSALSPAVAVTHNDPIRIVLATPPDGRPLHNPDNLTAEQVGVGWRLLLGEQEWRDYISYGSVQAWNCGRWHEYIPKAEFRDSITYRTPLSTPWPEAPKPDPYAHLKEAHAAGKTIQIFTTKWEDWPSPMMPEFGASPECYRIKPETIPLGPEDVTPFSVIRRKGEEQDWHWRLVSYVDAVKVTCADRGYPWAELATYYEINRSLPLTGKWNPDSWAPCHKPAP